VSVTVVGLSASHKSKTLGRSAPRSKVFHPVDVLVGSRVRLQRRLLRMSQEKLAEKLGLTCQQIQKYERGANRIGASRLFCLSKVLDVPVDFFFYTYAATSEGSAEKTDDALMHVLYSNETLSLNMSFARIKDTRTRAAVIHLLRALQGD
jgi:transcriptional regulator with XRE-family HTH domain